MKSGNQSCPSYSPMDCTVHAESEQVLEWVANSFSRDYLATQGIEPGSPTLRGAVFANEPKGSQNAWVGNLLLLQRIFPTQNGGTDIPAFKRSFLTSSYHHNPKQDSGGHENWAGGSASKSTPVPQRRGSDGWSQDRRSGGRWQPISVCNWNPIGQRAGEWCGAKELGMTGLGWLRITLIN